MKTVQPHPKVKIDAVNIGDTGRIYINGKLIAKFEFDCEGTITRILLINEIAVIDALGELIEKFGTE